MRNMMSQERNSNSPKGGLIVKRSYRWLAIGLAALAVSAFALTGCKGKEEPVDPFVNPGTTENPNWVVTVENDMTASMTAIVKVSFAQSEGTLAAFMGEDCCGIAEYNADLGLYWLYISPANANAKVVLRFYSPELKRVFDATETFSFRNDAILGSITDPYTPEWTVAD